MVNNSEERAHWKQVHGAFDGYMRYHLSANHSRRLAFLTLPAEQKELLVSIGFKDKLEKVDEGIRRNAEFVEAIISDPVFEEMLQDEPVQAHSHSNGHSHGHEHAHQQSHSHDRGHGPTGNDSGSTGNSTSAGGSSTDSKPRSQTQRDTDQAQDKVRSTLKQFVRDWSVEGRPEREACYTPCIDALEEHFGYLPTEERKSVKVLVPGAGLGRLAMDIASKGFASQGNEFSAYMLFASHFVLNNSSQAQCHEIYPFLHSFSHHTSTPNSLLRTVRIPDVLPADVLGQDSDFSLVAGDFEEVYGEDSTQHGQWGAVVTCFFIDTARNIINYLRIIRDLLSDGGVWINMGPLLWHFENSPNTSSKTGEGSIELSLDEVRDLAQKMGFVFEVERMIRTTYTAIPDSMLKHEYNAVFWKATKKGDASEP